MFETLCRCHSVEIDILDQQNEVSDVEDMTNDVMSIMCHFNAKKHGLRAAINNTYTLSPDGVELLKRLRDSGLGGPHILKTLRHEGITMTNGRGEVRPVSKWMVCKMLANELLEVAMPKVEEDTEKTSFELFAETHIKVTGKDTDKVMAKDIRKAYNAWCGANCEIPVSNVYLGKFLKNICTRRYLVAGSPKFEGLKLLG